MEKELFYVQLFHGVSGRIMGSLHLMSWLGDKWRVLKKLGLNMLNFHRTIGHSNVLDYADELGLLYFEEPGGNQYPISHFNDNNKQSKFILLTGMKNWCE